MINRFLRLSHYIPLRNKKNGDYYSSHVIFYKVINNTKIPTECRHRAIYDVFYKYNSRSEVNQDVFFLILPEHASKYFIQIDEVPMNYASILVKNNFKILFHYL
jgi:hypothetical protein